MSPRVATLHTPIPSRTRRASHLLLFSNSTPHFPTSLFSGVFLQARPDSCNLHIRIFIPRHFLIFASFSIFFSHAHWTSMQQSCIHISIHCYGPGIYSSIYIPRWDLPQKRLWGWKYIGIREGRAEELNYDGKRAKKLQSVQQRRSSTTLYVVWDAEELD